LKYKTACVVDTSVHRLLNVVKKVFVQVHLHSAVHMDNTEGSEHSQCIKIDYLLICGNNFDG